MEQAGRADDLTPEQKCFRIAQPQSTADHSRACVNAWTESLPSSQIGRWKRVIGDALRFHTDEAQAAEVAIAVEVLNRMLDLGRPNSVRVA